MPENASGARSSRRLAATVATRVYEPEGTAAAYRLGSLVRALDRSGYTVTVLTSSFPGGPASTAQVRRARVLRDRSGSVRGYLQYLSFDIPLFFRLLFGPRADVVIVEPPPTTGFAARIACWFRRTPYVYFSADVLTRAVKGMSARKLVVNTVRWLEQRSVRGAIGVLAVSDEVKREVIALGADEHRVLVIGTGVDTEKFCLEGPVAESRDPYFVYAGTMSEVHGAGVFLDAFEILLMRFPGVRLRFFGSGVDIAKFTRRASAQGSRVEIMPTVDASELTPWIRGARASLASVRPGTSYDFAFATKALASLSCGTPVIYAGVGPLAPLIEANRLGWATEWEPNAVAEAMAQAVKTDNIGPDARLSQWVEENHSLHSVAARGVSAINGWLRVPETT